MKLGFACMLVLALAQLGAAEVRGDVIGMHDLSPGGASPVQGTRSGSCTYCHVPHSGNGQMAPLWNQKLSKAAYQTYTSTTATNKGNQQLPLGSESALCLSCHDGTVAVGDTVLFGQLPIRGTWLQGDEFGTHLQTSHPFSLAKPLQDNIDLVLVISCRWQNGRQDRRCSHGERERGMHLLPQSSCPGGGQTLYELPGTR